MITDEERREAARVLRDMCEKAAPGNREWHTFTCYIEVNDYLAKHGARGLPRSVADLIDPGPKVDLGALLQIADAMDRDAEALGGGYGVAPDVLRSRAAEIRAACGEAGE